VPISGFSIHYGVKVVIINLTNGCQIISDHDPRAVFGARPGSTELERFYPLAAQAAGVLVPCELPKHLRNWDYQLCARFSALWEALSEKNRLLEQGLMSRVSFTSGMWQLDSRDLAPSSTPPHPTLDGIQWAAIESVDYTGQPETGYDLTVPGYETFMSADGVILSNTVSLHVPSTPEAVKDVREKMMPDKMTFSIKNRDATLHNPKHEQLMGLATDIGIPVRSHTFRTADEAQQAIDNGTVDLHDDIAIGDQTNIQPLAQDQQQSQQHSGTQAPGANVQ